MDDWKKPLSYEGQRQDRFENLRARLAEIGYAPEPVAAILGLSRPEGLYPLDYRFLPRWDESLSQSNSEMAPVMRLLLLGLPEDAVRLESLLGGGPLEFLLETNLAFRKGEQVHPRLSIVPFEGLLIATDRLFMNADPESFEAGLLSDNCVWRLDRTTLIMSKKIKRKKGENALELGCGSGVLSFLTAKNAEHIIGVDINPRAINVASFNARFNGAENVEFLQGDLYRPVKEKRFDYIFSNPPSAPGLVRVWNREGGVSGREMVEDMLKGLEEHLEMGGIFQTTMHFGYREKDDIDTWARKLVDPDRFEISYKLVGEEEDAEAFALREAHQKVGSRNYEIYQRTYRKYRENLENVGIEKISFGLLTIERRASYQSCA